MRGRLGLLLGLWAGCCVGLAGGAPVVDDPELWDAAPSTAGWENGAPIGVGAAEVDNPGFGGAGGAGDGYLRVTFDSIGPQWDTVYSVNEWDTGEFRGISAVNFLLWSDFASDGLVKLYLHSGLMAVGDVWEFGLGAVSAGGWQSYAVSLDYSAGWVGYGDAMDFRNDLGVIDWLGVNFLHPGGGSHVFGVDDWSYSVPEPSGIHALVAALISVVIPFARKRWVWRSGWLAGLVKGVSR